MGSSIEVVLPDDYLSIEDLLNRKFYSYEVGKWSSRFNHWFEQNPAFTSDEIRGYCIKNNGAIRGVIFAIPSYLVYGTSKYKAINISTWYVEKEYRNRSLNLLHKAINLNADIFFSTSIVSEQMKTTEMFGFKKYIKTGTIKAKMVAFNPINIGLYKIANKTISHSWINRVSQCAYKNFNSKSKFVVQEGIPENYDEFLESLDNDILTNDRSRDVINWLNKSPFRDVYSFGIFKDGNQVGMMLWKFLSDKLKTVECFDFLIDQKYRLEVSNSFNSILKQVVRLVNEKLDMMLIPEVCGVNDLSKIKGITVTRLPFNNKYYMSKSDRLTKLIEKEQFYFTNQGDMNL